jgi:hypothetical protein
MRTSNPNNLVKLTRALAWALCAAPLLMVVGTRGPSAAAPSDADSQPADTRISDDDPARSAFEKQWEQVQGWMGEHCPNRVRFMQQLRAGGPIQEQARRKMIERYNQIQKFPYKPMRDAVTAEFEAQDQVFGAQWDLRKARRASDTQLQTKAEADLRTAVTRLFDAQQTIKRLQLKRHQDEVERLKGEIDNQERRRAQLVENWYKNMKSRADSVIGGGPPGPSGRTQNAAPNDPRRPAHQE